jgi:hypothetical protein
MLIIIDIIDFSLRYINKPGYTVVVVGWVEGRSNKRFAARSSCPETQRLGDVGFRLFHQ